MWICITKLCQKTRYQIMQCFGSGFFFRHLDQNSLWVRIWIGQKSRFVKKTFKIEKMLYIISSTLNTVLFGQAPPKPYQNHHLDPISLLMDGSGLLKPGSGSAKKPGSIRIRNTGSKNAYKSNWRIGEWTKCCMLCVTHNTDMLLYLCTYCALLLLFPAVRRWYCSCGYLSLLCGCIPILTVLYSCCSLL